MNANEFRERMAALPEPATDLEPPYWEYWRLNLWRTAQIDDPDKFHLWPCVYHTMLVQHWIDAITYEWNQLDVARFSKAEYLKGILFLKEQSFRDNFFIFSLTNNLIHQAYHLQQWEEATGRRVENLKTIVEFGGGYGAMCLLCHQLGFSGRYIIYDLPEFSLLQQYYLSQCDIEAEWNPRRKPKNVDLFMALYSLSEIPIEDRIGLLAKSKSYLFLYSGRWEHWNNTKYFQEQLLKLFVYFNEINLNWKHTELQHLPDRNNWYSIAW